MYSDKEMIQTKIWICNKNEKNLVKIKEVYIFGILIYKLRIFDFTKQ